MIWAGRMLLGRPRDSAIALVCAFAIGSIVINSLYLQPGPHPAPIFVLKSPAVVADEPVAVGALLPRPRPVEAPPPEQRIETKRTEPVAVTTAKAPAVAARPAASRQDPIADLLGSGNQMTTVQRALSDFGYGPVAVTGTYGPETRAAIERFERDRKMPVTGQVSAQLLRELSQLVGKPI